MTTFRPTPAWWLPDRSGLVRPVSCSIPGVHFLFFEPTTDGIAGDAESAGQAAQTAALFIRAQDFLPLGLSVAVRLWLLAAAPPAIGAEVTLFAIAGPAWPDQFFAPTMKAFEREGNHTVSLHSLTRLSHYPVDKA